MLKYFPDERCSAQEALKNTWLDMPANFEYQMSEREYQSMTMINKNIKKKKKEKENVSTDEVITAKIDILLSDNELNMADDEDNDEIYNSEESDSDICEDEVVNIQNFNNSFAAYGQHINLSALDRANPQFDVLK